MDIPWGITAWRIVLVQCGDKLLFSVDVLIHNHASTSRLQIQELLCQSNFSILG